ncbi:SugE protein [Salmonella enterica subsp. houtenae]|nr:SugE protein [Salmonella enterica subsp. houtenae]
MSWIILLIAGLLEVVWAVGLKYTHGFSRLTPSIITITAMIVSIAMLSWAMKTLPVGTAYAIWTGIGAVGAAITGIILLGESATPARLLSLGLIVAGIIGLKLSTPLICYEPGCFTQINLLTSNPSRVATASICCFISSESVGVRESIHR